MFGIFLIMAVAVLGGVIAFVGDRVGMRVGRKRLTLFGLRPKYTSIGIAILTGVLTATCTLGILSIASENVRQAIFQFTQIKENLRTAQAKNLQLKKEYDQVDASLAEVTAKWQKARLELEGINERIAALTEARRRAEEKQAQAQAELSATTANLSLVKEQYDKAAAELAAVKAQYAQAALELQKTRADLHSTAADLRQAQQQFEQATAELAAVKLQFAQASQDLRQARTDLAKTAADLSQTKDQYNRVSSELTAVKEQYGQAISDLEVANDEVKFLQQRKDNLESAIGTMEARLQELTMTSEIMVKGVVEFATHPIIIHLGEVLAAGTVQPGQSFAEIQDLVMQMLNQADRVARDRGAAIGDKDVSTKVDINKLTKAYGLLLDLKSPAVVRVVSSTNTIAGNPAFVYLEVLPDQIVFRKGESVAQIEIRGAHTESEIMAMLVGDLLPKAHEAAEEQGMVNAGGSAPWPEPATLSELQDLAAQAAAANGVRVARLLAARDLRRVDGALSLSIALDTGSE